MTTELRVPDVTCGHCKATVEAAVTAVDGVEGAELDLESKSLVVAHADGVAEDDLRAAVERAGYSARRA